MKGSLTQPVEPQDSTDNALAHEVLGNKSDTSSEGATASLVALSRAIIDRLGTIGTAALATSAQAVAIIARLADPPGVDNAADLTPSDRIGLKADTVGGTSLISLVRQALAALAVTDAVCDAVRAGTVQTIAPNLAAGATITAGAGAWDLAANYSPIDVGVGVPAAAYKITQVHLNNPSGAQSGVLVLGEGQAGLEVEFARIPYEIGAAGFVNIDVPGGGARTASTRIAANLATLAGGAQTVDLKVVMEPIA